MRPTHRRRRSGRVRAVLSLGLLLGLTQVGTLASWTDSATVQGGGFSSGTLDLKVGESAADQLTGQGGSWTHTNLTLAAMAPGESVAKALTVGNGGSVALTYDATVVTTEQRPLQRHHARAPGDRRRGRDGREHRHPGGQQPHRHVHGRHRDLAHEHERQHHGVRACTARCSRWLPARPGPTACSRSSRRQHPTPCRARRPRSPSPSTRSSDMRARAATSLREAALTVGAGLGLVCLLLAVAAPLVGVRLLVFESGSMSPTVETGGVALTRTVAADDLAVGDVVSVIPASGVRVTHRIVDIDRTGGQTLLSLRGDANQAPDPVPYPVTEADRVIVHVNHLGFVVDALASPYAVFGAGVFVAVLLMLAFRRRGPVHQ